MTGAKAKRVVQVFLKTLLPFAIATLMIPSSCNGIVHCSIDQFACPDGSACISKSALCDGYTHCADWSDELATQCNSCTSSGLSKCRVDGTEFCIKEGAKCDSHCPVDQFACQTSHGRGPRAIGLRARPIEHEDKIKTNTRSKPGKRQKTPNPRPDNGYS